MHTQLAQALHGSDIEKEILSGNSAYERLKQYLELLNSPLEYADPSVLQRPTYPCFPELTTSDGFYDADDFETVKTLKNHKDIIVREARALDWSNYLTYFPRGKSDVSISDNRHDGGLWKIFFLRYMSADNVLAKRKCPESFKFLMNLEQQCSEYPWGDMLFSLHYPNTTLPAHCSVDNLRIRIHLGIDIPEGSVIRVGKQQRTWDEGECLVFDDSLEHEVWNNSQDFRLVFIMDIWHPELTAIERQVLTKMFNYWPAKKNFYLNRLLNTDASTDFIESITNQCRQHSGKK